MERTQFINLPWSGGRGRVNEAEAEALRFMAELERVKTAEMIRMLIREGARARGLQWPPVSVTIPQTEVADAKAN